MDDHITLSTRDNATLTVSRFALIAQSKVFNDMLSMNLRHETNDRSIPLDDTEADLEVFLPLLEGKETQESLNALNDLEWEAIARLADKYDCRIVRNLVEAKVWQIEADQGSPEVAFTLATLSGNRQLIKRTAKRTFLIEDLDGPYFHAPQEWKDKLSAWRVVQKAQYLDLVGHFLRGVPERIACPEFANCPFNRRSNFVQLSVIAVQIVDRRFFPDYTLSNYARPYAAGVCRPHYEELQTAAATFDRAVRETNDFPLDIGLGTM